jgi:sugar lactone lactonase YvrE
VFAPHGIDLVAPRMQPPRLLVVNHGGREAIEWFEVGTARGAPSLQWRGCALLPDGVWPNDVAALPGGGLVVTNMLGATSGLAGLIGSIELALGRDTGNALEWTPDGGWRALPGSEGSGPNGIAVDAAGRYVYVAEWGAQRLLRFQRGGDPEPASVDLPHHPDNITWASDGRLLVAGQIGAIWEVLACGTIRSGTCSLPFSVVAVDPETLATEVVIERDGTSGMGAATVALQNGEVTVLGTFAGDRVALFPFR